MSVKVRPYRRGGWEVDVRVHLPTGTLRRERKKISLTSRTAAQRWGEARERQLLIHGAPKPRREVPTLAEFEQTFIDGHVRANRQKPSGIANKTSIFKRHLVPFAGKKKLDAITTEDVQRLKGLLEKKSPKTVNNVLTVLNTALKKAVEWDVIDHMPCTVRLLPIPRSAAAFYDFDEFERLVTAAKADDRRAHLIALLGGEAGLPEMTPREGATRAGLQVHLKARRPLLILEFDRDQQAPGPVLGCMASLPCVVLLESSGDVRGNAYVVPFWIHNAFEHVDEMSQHTADDAKSRSSSSWAQSRGQPRPDDQ